MNNRESEWEKAKIEAEKLQKSNQEFYERHIVPTLFTEQRTKTLTELLCGIVTDLNEIPEPDRTPTERSILKRVSIALGGQ